MRNTYPGLDGRSTWLSWWLSWRLGLLVGLTVVALLLLPSIALAADYVVQPGDTLTRIAARNGTTTGALAKANAITNPDRIYVGQRLRLPGSVPSPTPAKTPVPSAVSYVTVKSGDTLSRIAGQSGSTVSALVKANGLADADLIYVGQRLKVPTAKAPPSPTPPAKVGAYVIPVAGYRDFVPTHWNGSLGAADLLAKKGTPVYSVASGRVVGIGTTGIGGNNVTIRGTDGHYYFAHLREYPLVRVGQTVQAGQRIGSVGDTGNAVGRPHLHLAIGDSITSGAGGVRGGYGTNFNVPSFLNRLIASAR